MGPVEGPLGRRGPELPGEAGPEAGEEEKDEEECGGEGVGRGGWWRRGG